MSTASELKKGSCFRHKGDILRVTRKELVAYGTHSHTKLKLFVQNVFGGGEKELTMMHHDKVELIEVQKKSATVIAKLQDKLQIMDSQLYYLIKRRLGKKEDIKHVEERVHGS